MLSPELIDSLFPAGLRLAAHWAERYPPRSLPAGAQVTRFAPSPTGWLHIGAVYTAGVNLDIARHSGGRYLLYLPTGNAFCDRSTHSPLGRERPPLIATRRPQPCSNR